MEKRYFIWIYCLIIAITYPSMAQEVTRLTSEEQRHLERALADAAYEQELRFSSLADEVDFWNDQRAFEQALFQRHPEFYEVYLYGKHIAYQEHLEDCSVQCGHGDYFQRQASFYSQYTARDEGVFLTLTQMKDARGWEVSYNTTRRNQ